MWGKLSSRGKDKGTLVLRAPLGQHNIPSKKAGYDQNLQLDTRTHHLLQRHARNIVPGTIMITYF